MPKLVYIAHPLAGDVDSNTRAIQRICREVHTLDTIPVVPSLVALQYLNDHKEEERELGIAANRECFERRFVNETWLFGPEISPGMKEEIKLSLKYNIPIVCKNPALEPELEQIRKDYASGSE